MPTISSSTAQLALDVIRDRYVPATSKAVHSSSSVQASLAELSRVVGETGRRQPDTAEIAEFLAALLNGSERNAEDYTLAALHQLHPTLEQAFFRLVKRIAFAYADLPDLYFDDRNRASQAFCKAIAGETDKRPNLIGLPTI